MKTLLFASLAAAVSMSFAAHAGTLVDVTVIDRDTGNSLPAHAKGGKLYVAGTPGHRYSVRISNRSGARVLTVLSVDGVNAISGETANAQQTGYVLDGYQSTEVNGWRKSMSEIAEFNFTALSDSYAARTGRPGNVGVIGVAVFRERPQPRIEPVIAARDDAPNRPMPQTAQAPAAAPMEKSSDALDSASGAGYASNEARRAPKQESIGTGHGAREYSSASYTEFVRESSQPNEVDSLWYDSYSNLIARGIIASPRPVALEPQPFPNQFAPDPR